MTSPQLPHPPFALAVFTLALSVTGLAPPALAQQEQLVLEEIIVTARKREERLMRVAQSVSAMGEAQIEAAFARDIRDLEEVRDAMHGQNRGDEPSLLRGKRVRDDEAPRSIRRCRTER